LPENSDEILNSLLDGSKRQIGPAVGEGKRLVSFISFRTLTAADKSSILNFIRWMRTELGLTAEIVGGGFGCTKVTVKIIELEAADASELEAILDRLLYDEQVQKSARRVPFDVIATNNPGARRSLRTGAVEGPVQHVTINAKEVQVGSRGGDMYSADRGGIAGKTVKIDQLTQTWNEWSDAADAPNLAALTAELTTLRSELKRLGTTPEQDADVGVVAQAEVAAKAGDGAKMLESLASTGKWVLGVAEQIGVHIAAAAIRKAMGLP